MQRLFQMLLLAMLFCAGCSTTVAPPAKQLRPAKHIRHAHQAPARALPAAAASSQQDSGEIVLLLPLTGNLAAAGTAVRDGFMAAEQQAGGKAVVETIDTNQVKPISAAYQQAVAKGARLVVGPLEKPAVAELAKQSLTVTTIALNQAPNASNDNLYQFGLSPQDEARQAAERAAQDGHHAALIIAPAGDWGNGVVNAFQQRWSELGGTVEHSLRFRLQDNLAEKIKAILGISGNSRWIAPKNRHQDFDMVFLAAPPAIARQIKPLLKFYYAGQIPIYATSFIYTGTPQPQQDKDLNGIIFCDIPWVLEPPALAAQLAQKDPRNFTENSRLYALGVDIYRLASQLKDLQASTGAYIQGVTGELYLAPRQQILRRLPWAKFRDGQPVMIAQ